VGPHPAAFFKRFNISTRDGMPRPQEEAVAPGAQADSMGFYGILSMKKGEQFGFKHRGLASWNGMIQ